MGAPVSLWHCRLLAVDQPVLAGILLHALFKQDRPVAAGILGAIERDVGLVVEIDRVIGLRSLADAERQGDRTVVDACFRVLEGRGRKGVADALCHLQGFFKAVITQNNGKLLAARARHKGVAAQVGANDGSDCCQDLVADRVAVAVIDLFEMVDIGDQQPGEATLLVGIVDRGEFFVEGPAIGQARQRDRCWRYACTRRVPGG